MMKYQIEVNVKKEGQYIWRPLSSSEGQSYVFETFDEAENMADWLYPHMLYGEFVRVSEIEKEA
jgi:hypothetical protein